MMSGTHSLAASSGLRTTYPRLDQNVRQNLRLEEKRNARIVFPVQSVWLLNQPHTIVLKGSQLEEEGEAMKRNLPDERQGRLQSNLHLSFLHIQDVPVYQSVKTICSVSINM